MCSYTNAQKSFLLSLSCIWLLLFLLIGITTVQVLGRKLYPQSYIAVFLSIGVFLRCLWLFLTYSFCDSHILELISSFSTLAGFSAISMLLVSWSRSLTPNSPATDSAQISRNVAAIADAESKLPNTKSTMGNLSEVGAVETGSRPASIRVSMNTQAALQKRKLLQASNSSEAHKLRKRMWLILNCFLWIIAVLIFIMNEIQEIEWISAAYSLLISILCLFVAILMVIVGYCNFITIRDDFMVSFQREQPGFGQKTQKPLGIWDFLCGFSSIHATLRMQSEALRTILSVSLIVCVVYCVEAAAVVYDLFFNSGQIAYTFYVIQFTVNLLSSLSITIVVGRSICPQNVLLWVVTEPLFSCTCSEYSGFYKKIIAFCPCCKKNKSHLPPSPSQLQFSSIDSSNIDRSKGHSAASSFFDVFRSQSSMSEDYPPTESIAIHDFQQQLQQNRYKGSTFGQYEDSETFVRGTHVELVRPSQQASSPIISGLHAGIIVESQEPIGEVARDNV